MLNLINALPKELTDWYRQYDETQREMRRRVRRLAKERHEARERHASRKPIDCASCSEQFIPVRTDSLYCSNKCRQRAHRARHSVTDNKRTDSETFISRYA